MPPETPDDAAVSRRRFLLLASGGAFATAAGTLLAGCGSGDPSPGPLPSPTPTPTPSPDPNPVIFSAVVPIDPAGGQVSDATRGIRVAFPPGSLRTTTEVTLEVRQNQYGGATAPGFTANPNGIALLLDTTALAEGADVRVEIASPSEYDELGSMLFATDDNGTYQIASVTFDADRSVLIGTLSSRQLRALNGGRGRGVLDRIVLFASTIVRVIGPAAGDFYRYGGETTDQKPVWNLDGSPGVTSGKRVAVLVHGVFNGRDDMGNLARFLRDDPALNAYNSPVYDQIWCYEYNFGAPIEDNGRLFAQKLRERFGDATTMDLFAHSMGGLVSRWALEKEGLGDRVTRLITLSTPHEGVPLNVAQLYVWLLSRELRIDIRGNMPGINDLVARVPWTEIPSRPSFLKRLNDGDSPFRASADYYTLAGQKWEGYIALFNVSGISVGNALNGLYNGTGSTVTFDGIVPQYSALSSVLNRKSASWSRDQIYRTVTVHLNHDEGNGDSAGTVPQQIMQDAVRPWIVASLEGTAR